MCDWEVRVGYIALVCRCDNQDPSTLLPSRSNKDEDRLKACSFCLSINVINNNKIIIFHQNNNNNNNKIIINNNPCLSQLFEVSYTNLIPPICFSSMTNNITNKHPPDSGTNYSSRIPKIFSANRRRERTWMLKLENYETLPRTNKEGLATIERNWKGQKRKNHGDEEEEIQTWRGTPIKQRTSAAPIALFFVSPPPPSGVCPVPQMNDPTRFLGYLRIAPRNFTRLLVWNLTRFWMVQVQLSGRTIFVIFTKSKQWKAKCKFKRRPTQKFRSQ